MNPLSRLTVTIMTVLMAGCGPARIIQESQKDSVIVIVKDTTIYRDSIIYVQVEAEQNTELLPDTDTSRLETRYAESEAYFSEGQLFHSLRNKSEALIPIETKIPITIHFESKESIKDKASVEIVEVEKQFSRWQRFIMAMGYGLLALLLAWAVRTLAKFLR